MGKKKKRLVAGVRGRYTVSTWAFVFATVWQGDPQLRGFQKCVDGT